MFNLSVNTVVFRPGQKRESYNSSGLDRYMSIQILLIWGINIFLIFTYINLSSLLCSHELRISLYSATVLYYMIINLWIYWTDDLKLMMLLIMGFLLLYYDQFQPQTQAKFPRALARQKWLICEIVIVHKILSEHTEQVGGQRSFCINVSWVFLHKLCPHIGMQFLV